MSKALINLRWPGTPPTLEQVEERFHLDPSGVDRRFGLVEIDPDAHLFALRLDLPEAEKIARAVPEDVEGPFSDPVIGPF